MSEVRIVALMFAALGSGAFSTVLRPVLPVHETAQTAAQPMPAPPVQTGQMPAAMPVLSQAITFDTPTPLNFEARAGEAALLAVTFLRNDSPRQQTATLRAQVVARDGSWVPVVVEPQHVIIASRDIRPVPLKLRIGPRQGDTSLEAYIPSRGWLIVTTPGSPWPAAMREIRLLSPMPSTLQVWIATLALGVALALVLLAAASVGGSMKLTSPMGSPTWSESWASNAAVGAGLLTALLSLAAFGELTHYMHKTGYLVCAALFGALVAAAPVVYGLAPKSRVRNGAVEERQGWVGMFLFASVLTLWAAFGQLALLFYVVRELALASTIGRFLEATLVALTVGMGVLLLPYAFISIRRTLAQTTVDAATRAFDKAAPPRAADWSVL